MAFYSRCLLQGQELGGGARPKQRGLGQSADLREGLTRKTRVVFLRGG